MATTLSRKNFFERQSVDTLRGDQPMDAGYVWTELDNINHMLDEAGKYRLNWATRTGNGVLFAADEHVAEFLVNRNYWWTVFPTQPVDAYAYPRYDVRVGFATGIDATVRISLVTPGTTPPILGDDQPGVIGSFTWDLEESLPDITYEWAEALLPSRSFNDAPGYIMPTPSYVDGDYSFGPLCLVKLVVECLDPTDGFEGGPVIVGVQVREYLR